MRKIRASHMVLVVKNTPANAGDTEMWVRSLGQEDLLEKGMVTHSSILAWRIPWTGEPGGLQSVHGVTKSRTGLQQLSMHTQRNKTFYFGVPYRLFIS